MGKKELPYDFHNMPEQMEKILNDGEQSDLYYKWRSKNKYFGKRFSILGDSISTLTGYNPEGYHVFYTGNTCVSSGVQGVKDTWWGKVIEYFGGELLVNNSWSGSRVTKLPESATLFPSGCSSERTGGLHSESNMPDVIIVYLGTNDWAYGVDVYAKRAGVYDKKEDLFVDGCVSGDESVFKVAYEKMLGNLKRNYPAAEIYCCTLSETSMHSNSFFKFPHTYKGIHIEDYNCVIRDVSEQMDCKVIDFYAFHLPYDAVDGTHPTADGMNTLASLAIHRLCDDEGMGFLEYLAGDKKVLGAIDLDPEGTLLLYSVERGAWLFNVDKKEEIVIYKKEFDAGRAQDCDLKLNNIVCPQRQAIFRFDGRNWLIRDYNTTNGTWLNGTRLLAGREYILHPDDIISFSGVEKFIFFKSQLQNSWGKESAVGLLEENIKVFYHSGCKDDASFQFILMSLTNVPLLLPLKKDRKELLVMEPYDDAVLLEKDGLKRIPIIEREGRRYIPMFTSFRKMNREEPFVMHPLRPQEYLPIMMRMNEDIIINPLNRERFVMTQKMMKEQILPIIEQSKRDRNSVSEGDSDKDIEEQIFGNKYMLIRRLGGGKKFQVYLAKDRLNKEWAVKVCDKTQPNFNDRIRNEIVQEPYIMTRLSHPAIPKVKAMIENKRYICVVREYIEGESLSDLLMRDGLLKQEQVINYGINLAEILRYIHASGYTYRDMKPSNVMVTEEGEIKLIDFGSVVECYSDGRNVDILSLGTKGYAAPEQYRGEMEIDCRADIYSLGITLYQLLTGLGPNKLLEVPPICKVNPKLSEELEKIICKCIETEPDGRYQTCTELIEDLENCREWLAKEDGL